jgi:hypothetical protein
MSQSLQSNSFHFKRRTARSSQINKSWLNHELHTSGGGQSPSGKRWRECLAGWRMAGLASRWSLKHAGKRVLALLLVLVGWGVVMPVQAELIAWYPSETDAKDHKPSISPYAKHNGFHNHTFSIISDHKKLGETE